jgi:hypothetical protein
MPNLRYDRGEQLFRMCMAKIYRALCVAHDPVDVSDIRFGFS